jgi:hypothetical protein
MTVHPPSCIRHLLGLSESDPEVCIVVPFRSRDLSLVEAQRIAATAACVDAEIVISDGQSRVPPAHLPGLLQLHGSRLEVQCDGPDALRAMELVTQQLRGLHGALQADARPGRGGPGQERHPRL